MRLTSLPILLFVCLISTGTSLYGQFCGCGEVYVYLVDTQGKPVDDATVEILNLWTGQPWRNCSGGSLTRQIGSEGEGRFMFLSWETGLDTSRLVVTAPGYIHHEEKILFPIMCGAVYKVVLERESDAEAPDPCSNIE